MGKIKVDAVENKICEKGFQKGMNYNN